MVENINFPVKGCDSCPDCGCEEDLVAKTISRLKDDKVVSEKIEATGLKLQIPLFNPQDLPKLIQTTLVGKPKVPMLTIYLRICAECKHVYLHSLDLQWQEVQIQMQKLPGFRGFPQNDPKLS